MALQLLIICQYRYYLTDGASTLKALPRAGTGIPALILTYPIFADKPRRAGSCTGSGIPVRTLDKGRQAGGDSPAEQALRLLPGLSGSRWCGRTSHSPSCRPDAVESGPFLSCPVPNPVMG